MAGLQISPRNLSGTRHAASINILPSDLLLEIFSRISQEPGSPGDVNMQWPAIRLVCKEWRSLHDAQVQELSPLVQGAVDDFGFPDMSPLLKATVTTLERRMLQSLPQLTALDLSRSSHVVSDEWLISALDAFQRKTFDAVATAPIKLTKLNLSNCTEITDAGLLSVSAITTLTHLNIQSCPLITSRGIQALSSLTCLVQLNLSTCYGISDDGLAMLASLSCLTDLDISSCVQLTDNCMQHVSGLTRLTNLSFGSYQNTSASFDALASLPQLASFTISGCNCSQPGDLAKLHRLRGLTHLGLIAAGLNDSCFSSLPQSSSLVSLSLAYNGELTDASLRFLATLRHVKVLDLSWCCAISDNGLQALQPLNLLELNLSGCQQVNGIGLRPLSTLQRLYLANSALTNKGMAAVARLTNLRILDCTRCNRVTNAGLHPLRRLSHLKFLNLAHCFKISRRGLAALSHLPALEDLDLSFCRLGSGGVELMQKLTTLTNLNISYSEGITADGVKSLCALPHFHHVKLAGCFPLRKCDFADTQPVGITYDWE